MFENMFLSGKCLKMLKLLMNYEKHLRNVIYQNVMAVDENSVEVSKKLSRRRKVWPEMFANHLEIKFLDQIFS